jgi:lipopolysaccharide export LptBFGC system permease protein LptF
MTTITVDIIDDKAFNLLKDLEAMNIIKVHDAALNISEDGSWSIKNLKGKMTKQSVDEIEKQLTDFREE